jgi:K+-sensing histidine kinase KdpD
MHDDKVVSLITVARNNPQPFNTSHQAMLELVVNVASSALENWQRFHQLERSLSLLQQSYVYTSIESSIRSDLLRQASLEIRMPLKNLMENVDVLLEKGGLQLTQDQAIALDDIQEDSEVLMDIADSMINSRQIESMRLVEFDLTDLVRNTTNRFKPIAQLGKITIQVDAPAEPVSLKGYPSQITKVFEGLLSNALKYSPPSGEIRIQISQTEHDIFCSVSDQGNGIDEQASEWLFQQKSNAFGYSANRFGGIGISLPVIKEIITTYKGKIWVQPLQEKGFEIAFSLPR